MVQTIETKVIAAAAGGGLGASVGAFVLWLLGVTAWHASNAAGSAGDAVAAVPTPVSGLVLAVLGLVGAALAGYLAPHTVRATVENTAPIQSAPSTSSMSTAQLADTARANTPADPTVSPSPTGVIPPTVDLNEALNTPPADAPAADPAPADAAAASPSGNL
jgi:hypothetical protein